MAFDVAGTEVGRNRAFVIAEVGSNHGGDVGTAEKLIDAAAAAGADAVKYQCRTNTELFSRAAYEAPYDSENAFGPTYGSHREALELDEGQLSWLRDYATGKGLITFATAFDLDAVDKCVHLGFPAIKIASGSITNTPLIAYAASTNLPIFLSTGGSKMEDVERAVEIAGNKLCLMQCTATYPSDWEDLDISVISTYTWRFPKAVIGFSSHVPGISDGTAAYVMGARVFEKHVTWSRAAKGTDHAFSLEPNGLRRYVRDLRRCEVMLGDGSKRLRVSELEPIRKMSSSLYTNKGLHAGHLLTAADICIKSPGDGIPPYELQKVLGLELIKDLAPETPIRWENVYAASEERHVV